jgi:predicted HAD superfamily Cof-like phosphohydrolase
MESKDLLLKKIMAVHEFHEVFRIGNAQNMCSLEERDYMLRYNLLKEENEEYLEAARNGDIAFGTLLKHGLHHKIDEVFDEIHRSNMSKLDENGQPIFREDGKILKSNLYFKPDIGSILEK